MVLRLKAAECLYLISNTTNLVVILSKLVLINLKERSNHMLMDKSSMKESMRQKLMLSKKYISKSKQISLIQNSILVDIASKLYMSRSEQVINSILEL